MWKKHRQKCENFPHQAGIGTVNVLLLDRYSYKCLIRSWKPAFSILKLVAMSTLSFKNQKEPVLVSTLSGQSGVEKLGLREF